MPRRIPIRLKLATALAVPLFALLLVSALEVLQSTQRRNDTQAQTELATASIGPGGLITGLQNERNYGSIYMLGFESTLQLPVTSFEEAAAATDQSIATFRTEIESKGGDVARTYAPALDAIDEQLGELRTVVYELEGPRDLTRDEVADSFFTSYTELIDTLFQANGQVALAIDDPTLRRGVELTDLASHQIENVARITRLFLLAGVGDGLDTPDEIADAAALLGQIHNVNDQVRDLGTGRYAAASATVLEQYEASGHDALARETIDTGDVDIPATMSSISREDDEGFNGYRTAINEHLTDRADTLNAEATASNWRYIGLGVLALAVAVLVTWLVSRSITRPLRSLTHQAKEMAEHRLPEAVTDILETPLGEDVTVPSVQPVSVNTRDEVADVADALNTVQDSALDLAVEQAVLRRNIADSFVNLGRRNQNLLGRQLDFITELESNETDADTLANLFRLDHLATRMRRNAESLLVLAGIEPPRQWAAPVRLTDVIRAALGEVEDYQRVTVRGVEAATIIGSAAADLAHLLAELIENALVFSPPDQNVDIRGRNRPDGYTLAIIDSGLGMPAGDITAANRRLAGAESFTIAPSKYLGHYVAGNLAARHDIHVHLDNSPGNGITATIDLPPTLLTTDTDLAAPVTPPHGTPQVAGGAAGAIDPFSGLGVPGSAPSTPVPASPFAAGAPPQQGDIPPPPVLDAPAAGAPSAPAPPALPTRTASGLVKRAPRGGGQSAPGVLDSQLLASLSSVTGNLGPRHSAPSASAHDPQDQPRPPQVPGRAPGRPPTGPRSWPAPPAPRPAGPPPASGHPGGDGRPPLPARRGDDRQPPVGGATPGRPPADTGATPGGLARRVRGAQLPVSQPLNLRRSQERPSGGDAGYRLDDRDNANGHMLGNTNTNGYATGPTNGHANGHVTGQGVTDQDDSAARSVYGFLTSFTQGVQRGLEDARRDPNTPKENP